VKIECRCLIVELLTIGGRMKAEVALFQAVDAQGGRSNIGSGGFGPLADRQAEAMDG
jgi:hypothetical protein